MSRQYTTTSQYVQGHKFLRLGNKVKSNSKDTMTNHKLKIVYYICYKLYYCRSRVTEKIKEMRAEKMRRTVEERVKLARSAAPQGSSNLLVR